MKCREILFSILFIISFALFAEDKQGLLNKLLAPGPLIAGHAHLEKVDCLSCHDAGKGVQNNLCLNCHKTIKESIERKNTFHGLIVKKDCISCHNDHKGRDFDTTKIDLNNFDHSKTGHILHGKHQKIKCIECHKETRAKMGTRKNEMRFIGLVTNCKTCHLKDDVHLFKDEFSKKDCNFCHNEVKWKDAKNFDHGKIANFPLVGKHQELTCSRCHTPNGEQQSSSIYRWDNLKDKNCLSCHRPFHQNNLSEKYSDGKCDRCHDQNSWKIKKFNHEMTGMTLNGKHSEISCLKCHKENSELVEVRYKAVTGLEKMVSRKWVGQVNTCQSCHRDIHNYGKIVSNKFGKLENCQVCHNERSFKEGVNFNHNLDTRFKVDGKHRDLSCVRCHKNSDETNQQSDRVYKFKDFEKDNCNICHQSPHLKTFSKNNLDKKCSVCHSTSSWKDTRKSEQFNHDVDTPFSLDGKHAKLECKTCHNEGDKKIFKFDNSDKQYCESCHSNVHLGQFSDRFIVKSCLECHTTDSFKNVNKFDHNKTNFQLTGAHVLKNLNCKECHLPTKENFISKGKVIGFKGNFKFIDDKKGQCESCHKNVHYNQFSKTISSRACTTCHSTENFQERKKFDHGITNFPINGLHEKLDCVKCHKSTNQVFEKTKKKGSVHNFSFPKLAIESCKVCHVDVHKGEFGNSCKDCHSETKKWKGTENFHKNFLLNGIHYSLKCNECHRDQRHLGGMSENCQMCHQKDDRHRGTLPNCKECHRQEFWEVTTFKHSRTTFPLRGIHRTLACDSCHQGGMYQGKSSECISCHLSDKRRAPNHNITGFEDCSHCHNQFVFK